MLADGAPSTLPALASDAIVNATPRSPTLPTCVFVIVVLAYSAPLAILAVLSNPFVLTNTCAATFFAARLDAVVRAEMTGGGAVPAGVLDFIVGADVGSFALPVQCMRRLLREEVVPL